MRRDLSTCSSHICDAPYWANADCCANQHERSSTYAVVCIRGVWVHYEKLSDVVAAATAAAAAAAAEQPPPQQQQQQQQQKQKQRPALLASQAVASNESKEKN